MHVSLTSESMHELSFAIGKKITSAETDISGRLVWMPIITEVRTLLGPAWRLNNDDEDVAVYMYRESYAMAAYFNVPRDCVISKDYTRVTPQVTLTTRPFHVRCFD